jgi:hypothetical protein
VTSNAPVEFIHRRTLTPRDDDVRSDLRMLHADLIGYIRAQITTTHDLWHVALPDGVKDRLDYAITFLKEVPCPPPE